MGCRFYFNIYTLMKKDLEKRVEELERLVRELIQWKEDKKIIQIDKNRKESWLAIHNYHIEETKKEDEVYDEDEVDEEYEEDDEIRLLNSIS